MELLRPPRALPENHPLFAREDWPVVRKKAKALAYRLRPTLAEAQDLAHAAILSCIVDPSAPWKLPTKELIKALGYRVARLAFNQQRHEDRFPKDSIAQEGADEQDDGSSYTVGHILRGTGASPEEAYLSAEAEAIYRRRLDDLARRVADDALVTLLVAEVSRDSDSPMAAALAKGFNAEDIYNARKRLERAAHAVLDDERKATHSPLELQ